MQNDNNNIIPYFLQHAFKVSKKAMELGLPDSKSSFVNFCKKSCEYFEDRFENCDDDDVGSVAAIDKVIKQAKESAKDVLLFTNQDLEKNHLEEIAEIAVKASNGDLTKEQSYKFANLDNFCSILELNEQELKIVKFLFAVQYITFMQYDWRMRYCVKEVFNNIPMADFLSCALDVDLEICKEKLDPNSDLFLCGFLQFVKKEESHQDFPPYKINQKIVKVLWQNSNSLTQDQIIDKLFPNNLINRLTLDDFHQKQEIEIITNILNHATKNQHTGINILLWGQAGCGKTELAQLLALNSKYRVISVGLNSEKEESRGERINDLILAQKIFSKLKDKTIILFDEMEDIEKIDINAQISKGFINRLLENNQVPIIWTCNHIQLFDVSLLRRMTYNMEFKIPNSHIRRGIWQKINQKGLDLDAETLKHIPLVPSAIYNAVYIAEASGLKTQQVAEVAVNIKSLMDYGHRYQLQDLNAPRINIDLINSDFNADILAKLQKSANTNFSMCFYGASGTGKSAMARHIAEQLGLDVVYKNASDIFGKFVGETEQNIRRAFEESTDMQALLIFDEVDSFLQDRRSAKNSWEVSQVNEFLTCLERHRWPVVATTNLVKYLDKASLRRFTFKYRFDFVDKTQYSAVYEYFFGTTPQLPCPSDILSLGDFSVVKKKVDVLGYENEAQVRTLLTAETVNKTEYTKKIGF